MLKKIVKVSVTDFCLKAPACTEALPVRVVLSGFGLTGGGKLAPGGEERTERGEERRAAGESGQGGREEEQRWGTRWNFFEKLSSFFSQDISTWTEKG